MAWSKWEVLIYIGTGDTMFMRQGEKPHNLGIIKARTRREAERKSRRLVMSLGLSGLIKIEPIVAHKA